MLLRSTPIGYKISFTQRKIKNKTKQNKTHTHPTHPHTHPHPHTPHTQLKCTQIHLFSFKGLSITEKIPLKSNAAKEKKRGGGFRVELRAKSNFKSNARGKLRQTIFFWPYFEANNLFSERQSACRKHHSTETALVCVSSHNRQDADKHGGVVQVILNLNVAFDTVERVVAEAENS